MTNLHILTPLTDSDREKLRKVLKEKKSDFRMDLVITVAITLIAPFMTSRSGHKPMIEDMSYGKALLFIGIFMGIYLLIRYFVVLHAAVRANQSDLKRVIITKLVNKFEKPVFRKDKYMLMSDDKYAHKLYLPRKDYEEFDFDELICIELSEMGRQVIKITSATEAVRARWDKKEDQGLSSSHKKYFPVLFGTDSKEKGASIFSFFIPNKFRFFSTIFIDINILVFIAMMISGVSVYKPTVPDLIHWGGNAKILTFGEQEYWRLFTNIFVHGGIIHLVMNTIGLVLGGLLLEFSISKSKFLLVYLFSGLTASLMSAWWHDNVVSVGASGAIFGLFGAVLSIHLFSKPERKINTGEVGGVLALIGYNLIMGLFGNTDNAAHIGGLIGGFFIGMILVLSGNLNRNKSRVR